MPGHSTNLDISKTRAGCAYSRCGMGISVSFGAHVAQKVRRRPADLAVPVLAPL